MDVFILVIAGRPVELPSAVVMRATSLAHPGGTAVSTPKTASKKTRRASAAISLRSR